jgi:hypothetical protein
MKSLILLLFTPFLLSNSAPVGALIPLLLGALLGLGVIIGIIWAVIKFFTS